MRQGAGSGVASFATALYSLQSFFQVVDVGCGGGGGHGAGGVGLAGVRVRVLVLLPRLAEQGELAMQHVCGGGHRGNCRFGEQRAQRGPVILLSRGEMPSGLTSGQYPPRPGGGPSGQPGLAGWSSPSLPQKEGDKQYLCVVQTASLSEDFQSL